MDRQYYTPPRFFVWMKRIIVTLIGHYFNLFICVMPTMPDTIQTVTRTNSLVVRRIRVGTETCLHLPIVLNLISNVHCQAHKPK